MRMKKLTFLSLFLSLLVFSLFFAALAEPLILADPNAGEVIYSLGDSGMTYTYAYAYPRVDESELSAQLINSFYDYKVSDALDFEVPMLVDYYTDHLPDTDIFVRITFEVTCNTEDYFSVLIRSEGNDYLTWTGHTFSRNDLRPGSSVALPYLLGLLASEESDTWLQDRQTARADELVRAMVWEQLSQRMDLPEDLDEAALTYLFYPEEDFYLDAEETPVFYLEPGLLSDSEESLLIFPIPVADILDEM